MPYLLDGNNLIGLARGVSRPSRDDRDALIAELVERLRRTRARVVVFFDGPEERTLTLGSLTVRDSGGLSADDAILRELRRSRSPREITVVTADRGLSGAARDAGAKTLRPSEFWGRFGGATAAAPAEESVDVEEWLRYFQEGRNGSG
jgi:predicted RNA-binding protein with PIN domain